MKLKLLLIASAALVITSCSKNNDELPILKSTDSGEQSQTAERKRLRLFVGQLTLQPDTVNQFSCGCAPGFFAIGPFSGTGAITNFGYTVAITTPCVANIPNGLHADTQCLKFTDVNGEDLYMEAAAPYDNVVDTTTFLIVGKGVFKITGGTGKYLNARGRYRALVVNNQLIAPPGTATVVTTIKGFIIY
ncbi:MAG: hypothetical protein ABI723_06555 [Bacteroidia bacterium]